jgi:hypothetical protein
MLICPCNAMNRREGELRHAPVPPPALPKTATLFISRPATGYRPLGRKVRQLRVPEENIIRHRTMARPGRSIWGRLLRRDAPALKRARRANRQICDRLALPTLSRGDRHTTLASLTA